MQKKIKIISTIAVSLTLVFNTLCVMAADQQRSWTDTVVKEIVDTDDLIERAKAGIDDFKEVTGRDFNVYVEAKMPTAESEGLDLTNSMEIYKTSQYLGKIVNEDGGYDDLYVLEGIVAYPIHDVTQGGTYGNCTLTTKMYFQFSENYSSMARMINSTGKVTGSLHPVSMFMENRVYDWDNDSNHYNSNTVITPTSGTTYTLYPSYYGAVDTNLGTLDAKNTAYFSGGGSLSVGVDFTMYMP